MNPHRLGAAARVAVIVAIGAAVLSACSADADAAAQIAAEALPDLAASGLEAFECGDGEAIGGTFQAPADPYVAECWTGVPTDGTFLDLANSTQDAIVQETGGSDITAEVCPEDAFGENGGIACRAALVTEGDSSVVVRTVVVLTDPNAVIAKLPEDPTAEQVNEALVGAPVEVLVGSQPATEAAPEPSAS